MCVRNAWHDVLISLNMDILRPSCTQWRGIICAVECQGISVINLSSSKILVADGILV